MTPELLLAALCHAEWRLDLIALLVESSRGKNQRSSDWIPPFDAARDQHVHAACAPSRRLSSAPVIAGPAIDPVWVERQPQCVS